MIITIGGPPGSGKTTVARLLSKKLCKEVVVIGEIFRSLAKERGYTLSEFGEIAARDHTIDLLIDKRTVEIAKKGDLILEGRLAGAMMHKNGISAFKVWLEADIEIRASRIARREGDAEEILTQIRTREQCESKRYKDIYGIMLQNTDFYDMIIDTSKIPAEEVVNLILEKLKV